MNKYEDPIKDLLEAQVNKSKHYLRLRNSGIDRIEAAYRAFGTEIGDEMAKLYSSEVSIKMPNNN